MLLNQDWRLARSFLGWFGLMRGGLSLGSGLSMPATAAIRRFTWASALGLITAVALNSHGQISGLPEKLCIGSEAEVLEWVATNRLCIVDFQIKYITSTNANVTRGREISGSNVSFGSYADFQYCLLTNGVRILNDVKSQSDIGSPLMFYAAILYTYPDQSFTAAYSAATNIGPVSTITSNTFVGIHPDWTRIAVPVPGLQQLHMDVATTPPYSFTWTPNGSYVPPNQYVPTVPERTTNDLLILSEWYATGAYRARFSITAGGRTNVYTQHGEVLSPATLRMTSRTNLVVSMAKGSDTVIQSSGDLVHWQTWTTFSWSKGTNMISSAVNPNLPGQFFRAYSQ